MWGKKWGKNWQIASSGEDSSFKNFFLGKISAYFSMFLLIFIFLENYISRRQLFKDYSFMKFSQTKIITNFMSSNNLYWNCVSQSKKIDKNPQEFNWFFQRIEMRWERDRFFFVRQELMTYHSQKNYKSG